MPESRTTTGPPDFIGVGAQRSGTTWWFGTMLGHPQIAPPRERKKELHFFNRFRAREMTGVELERTPDEVTGLALW